MLNIEHNPHQILVLTIDTTHICNLSCSYCLQGMKTKDWLPAKKINEIFLAAEKLGVMEVYLSGAETTMHPEFDSILKYTHSLKKTGLTLITNGTKITPRIAKLIRESRIDRVAISIDGPDEESHNSARGKSFKQTMRGLELLQSTGKSITVISVAHQKNYKSLFELTEFLVKNKLALQHHIMAVSRSGLAIDIFDKIKLTLKQFNQIQSKVDKLHSKYIKLGFHLIFNSYWHATGLRPSYRNPRELTSFELVEQLKNHYAVARVKGDLQITSLSWAREFSSPGIMGSIYKESPYDLLVKAAEIYSSKSIHQHSREYEAIERYRLFTKPNARTDIEIPAIEEFDLLKTTINQNQLRDIANNILTEPKNYRICKISGSIYAVYNYRLSHVILLKKDELNELMTLMDNAR